MKYSYADIFDDRCLVRVELMWIPIETQEASR